MRAEQQNTTDTYEGNAVQVSDLSGIIMTCSGPRRLLEGDGMMNERGIGSPERLLTSVARERVAPQLSLLRVSFVVSCTFCLSSPFGATMLR
jgi:hypothetical protein